MNKRVFPKVLFAAFAAAILSLATGAKAQSLFPNGPAYGLSSIASSETLLLKLFNRAPAGTASWTVRTDLINDAGANLGPATRTLAPGQIAMLTASDFTTGTTTTSRTKTAAAAATTHISLQPQITFLTQPPDPCLRILPTFEIVDRTSGRTNRIAQALPPVPVSPQTPPGPIRFGFGSTTSADILRLAVVNTALSSSAGICQVQAGFVESLGNVPQMQTASLGAGQSPILNQAGRACLRPVVRFALPNPCRGLIQTVESVDAASDVTRFFYPPNPILAGAAD
jgi:hypothetical protein